MIFINRCQERTTSPTPDTISPIRSWGVKLAGCDVAVFIKLETKKITSNRDDLFRMNSKMKRIIVLKISSLQSQEQFSKYVY